MTNEVFVKDVDKMGQHEEMVKRMRDNELIIARHEEKLAEHDRRLDIQSSKIESVEASSVKLENLVMTENKETRSVIIKTNQELHTLINNLLGYKSGENQLKHNIRMQRAESIVKIISMLAGSGGILYYLFGQ